jgi:uncharacterized protein
VNGAVRAGLPTVVAALLVALLLNLLAWALPAWGQQDPGFPPLTGRVVDAARILDPGAAQAIAAKLQAYEQKTSDQVVVATVPSLRGLTVEDYANRLFRAWRLGQAKNDNGVLFLVAPNERRVRIEVGYGLEGALTDALSKVIIATSVAPRFQQGDFAGGINAGVDAILPILQGDAQQWQRRPEVRAEERTAVDPVMVLIFLVVLFWIVRRALGGGGGRGGRGGRSHRTRRGNWVILPIPSGGGFWGGGGGGFSGGFGGGFGGGGGGFSGGGGSSGGGGASGSW